MQEHEPDLLINYRDHREDRSADEVGERVRELGGVDLPELVCGESPEYGQGPEDRDNLQHRATTSRANLFIRYLTSD